MLAFWILLSYSVIWLLYVFSYLGCWFSMVFREAHRYSYHVPESPAVYCDMSSGGLWLTSPIMYSQKLLEWSCSDWSGTSIYWIHTNQRLWFKTCKPANIWPQEVPCTRTLYIRHPKTKDIRKYLSWVINIIHLMLKCSHIQFQYVFFPVRSCQLRDTLVVVHWFTTTWYTPQEDSGAEHFLKQNMNRVLSHTLPCWIAWWTQALNTSGET